MFVSALEKGTFSPDNMGVFTEQALKQTSGITFFTIITKDEEVLDSLLQ